MKKKKLGIMIFVALCVIVIIVCVVIQVIVRKDMQKLEKEAEKYETMITETKSGEEIETQYIHVEEDKFFIKVPTSFQQLDYETITKKYNGDVPDVVFSNDDTKINVAINMTDIEMQNDEVLDYRTQFEDIYKDRAEILSTDYYEVNGHNVGQIKMVSEAIDTTIYNNTIFFSYNDKLVIATFNCTEDLREDWENVGDFIIDSLFFTDNNE